MASSPLLLFPTLLQYSLACSPTIAALSVSCNLLQLFSGVLFRLYSSLKLLITVNLLVLHSTSQGIGLRKEILHQYHVNCDPFAITLAVRTIGCWLTQLLMKPVRFTSRIKKRIRTKSPHTHTKAGQTKCCLIPDSTKQKV